MRTIQVEISEDLLEALKVPDERSGDGLKALAILELYREGVLSLGKAAEMSGMSVQDFLAFSAERDVSLHYAKEDLKKDLETVRRLFP